MSACHRPHAVPLAAASTYVLQRFGGRPVKFAGQLLACSDEAAPPAWSRLRLAIYQCSEGGFVCELICRAAQSPHGFAMAGAFNHVARAESLPAALAFFEHATAPDDGLAPVMAPDDATAALFQAAARLCRATAQQLSLGDAVGQFLYRFCVNAKNAA